MTAIPVLVIGLMKKFESLRFQADLASIAVACSFTVAAPSCYKKCKIC